MKWLLAVLAPVFAAAVSGSVPDSSATTETVRMDPFERLAGGHYGNWWDIVERSPLCQNGHSWQFIFDHRSQYSSRTPSRGHATLYWDCGQVEAIEHYQFHLRRPSQWEPLWMDLEFKKPNGDVWVRLGIIIFSENRLIWIAGRTVDSATWREAKGNLPGRPTHFSRTQEKGTERIVLKRQG